MSAALSISTVGTSRSQINLDGRLWSITSFFCEQGSVAIGAQRTSAGPPGRPV
jgi:hypothetical protein